MILNTVNTRVGGRLSGVLRRNVKEIKKKLLGFMTIHVGFIPVINAVVMIIPGPWNTWTTQVHYFFFMIFFVKVRKQFGFPGGQTKVDQKENKMEK